MYELLRDHYVTDDVSAPALCRLRAEPPCQDMMFRFDYPIPLLQWAMMPPGELGGRVPPPPPLNNGCRLEEELAHWRAPPEEPAGGGLHHRHSVPHAGQRSRPRFTCTSLPAAAQVYGKKVKMVEINFLCVHKQYRDKRLAPALITGAARWILCVVLLR